MDLIQLKTKRNCRSTMLAPPWTLPYLEEKEEEENE